MPLGGLGGFLQTALGCEIGNLRRGGVREHRLVPPDIIADVRVARVLGDRIGEQRERPMTVKTRQGDQQLVE